jgi:hypothetical protein
VLWVYHVYKITICNATKQVKRQLKNQTNKNTFTDISWLLMNKPATRNKIQSVRKEKNNKDNTRKIPYFLCLLFCVNIISCTEKKIATLPGQNPNALTYNFTVDQNQIFKNGIPFTVRGVVYVPFYPGYLPWVIERENVLDPVLNARIEEDIRLIKSMGANTIRLWGAPKKCYEAIKQQGGIHFIQTIWIDGEQNDFQENGFKEQTKAYVREVVDRIYGVFSDKNPPLVAYLMGNELSRNSILQTNLAHPTLNTYQGVFVRTSGVVNATEVFLAEMADYLKQYESSRYGRKSLVSYANDIRTAYDIDVPFLDFRSHNAYSYAVPYYRPGTLPGSTTGTKFQGWVEELKRRFPDKPLLLTETGLSVSPNAQQVGAPNYGYGGNSELEQAAGIISNLEDINTASVKIAGACIHEYLDSWWKFGLDDSYTQDGNDVEEWFGLMRMFRSGNGYSVTPRPAYQMLQGRWR